ncbi:MAG TPA: DUF6456 domain-containing protein [Xanthobacteraceae bacterium]|nr:DUF6456 domain-containing protein [Xanthobacteraceae bacterium]
MTSAQSSLPASAERLLAELAGLAVDRGRGRRPSPARRERDLNRLITAGLIVSQDLSSSAKKDVPAPVFVLTAAGRAHLARRAAARTTPQINPFQAQHLELVQRKLAPRQPPALVNAAESPVAWLAQRGLLAPSQMEAAERLRADFTRAQLLPHTTLNWTLPVVDAPRGPLAMRLTEAVVAARQRVRRAVETVGPELSGMLLDVCCFLKPLAQVEHERRWPPRSGKVVLGMALAALARHYGLSDRARGSGFAATRAWNAAETKAEVGTKAEATAKGAATEK